MNIALLVEIHRSCGASRLVDFDTMHVGIGANFAAASAFCYADCSYQRAGLCAHFASKAQTEAALHARAAPGPGLRKNRHGRGERMPAKFARRAFKKNA